MKNLIVQITVLIAVIFIPANVEAQTTMERFHEETGDREILTQIILDELTIWTRPANDERVYVRFCRNLRHGCEREIATYINYIFDVAYEQDVDPWLLVALAWHESRFNAFAESPAGAFGIFQFLRRGAWSRGLPFVRSRWYRERCRTELGSCQYSSVRQAVFWITESIAHCGSVRGGLRMYNSGSCHGPRRYASAILNFEREFLERAERIREMDVSDQFVCGTSEPDTFLASNRSFMFPNETILTCSNRIYNSLLTFKSQCFI